MDLPGGTVTFLFTDIEGSTRLWEREPGAMQAAVARHDALLAGAVERYAGNVVKTTGDGMLAVFVSAPEAARSALAIQRALRDEAWDAAIGQLRVRAALHTGTAELREDDYFGTAVNRAARLLSAGHGGQTLISMSTQKLVQDHLPEGATLSYLGEYRLRDLSRPERVYQLNAADLPADFPPLRTRSTRPTNLPPQPTAFVGRERELADLEGLLGDAAVRLVTIVGPGGMGKTRLAVAAAELLLPEPGAADRNFPDGVFFVPLAALASADHIVGATAEALDFRIESGLDDSGRRRSPLQQLVYYLYSKRLLLILDNFEHLLDGSALVSQMLQSARGVTVLATSRERLNLREEQLYPIQGLELPEEATVVEASQESAASYASVQLFLDGAGRTQPGFRLTPDNAGHVAHLCRLVEGMPLGIELAASWADLLSLEEIAAEIQANLDFLETDMRDVPGRHRSIRAVFDTSWERLGQDEREVFAQLSVFRGGFTRKAAEEVAGASLRHLARLSNKSLLGYRKSRERYQVHELLRQYAAERLAQDPSAEEAVRGRHSAYYCEALAALEPDLKGARQQEALILIRADDENVRAAWLWAVDRSQVSQIGRTVTSLSFFYLLSDRYEEGELTSKEAVEKLTDADGAESQLARARLLTWQSYFAMLLGQRVLAGELLSQALTLLNQLEVAGLDVQADVALAEYQHGQIVAESDLQTARELYEKSLALSGELGDQWGLGLVLQKLGTVAHFLGEYEEAKRLLEAALAVRREIGDREGMAETLGWLAHNAYYTGRPEEGEGLARESLALFESLGHRSGIALGLSRLGIALFFLNKYEEAYEVLEKALTIYQELGERSVPARAYLRLAIANVNLGRYEEGRTIARKGLALARRGAGVYLAAWALWILGFEALARGNYRQSQRSLQESVALYREIGDQSEIGYVQATLGMAERGLGHIPEARRLLLEVLRTVPAGDTTNLGYALPGVALLLADQGEFVRTAELYGLLSQYHTNARPRHDIYLHYLAEVVASLSPEEAEAAQERGRQRDLWETAQVLLGELPELGWEG